MNTQKYTKQPHKKQNMFNKSCQVIQVNRCSKKQLYVVRSNNIDSKNQNYSLNTVLNIGRSCRLELLHACTLSLLVSRLMRAHQTQKQRGSCGNRRRPTTANAMPEQQNNAKPSAAPLDQNAPTVLQSCSGCSGGAWVRRPTYRSGKSCQSSNCHHHNSLPCASMPSVGTFWVDSKATRGHFGHCIWRWAIRFKVIPPLIRWLSQVASIALQLHIFSCFVRFQTWLGLPLANVRGAADSSSSRSHWLTQKLQSQYSQAGSNLRPEWFAAKVLGSCGILKYLMILGCVPAEGSARASRITFIYRALFCLCAACPMWILPSDMLLAQMGF